MVKNTGVSLCGQAAKKVLVHEQYTLMKTWMGQSLGQLRRDQQVINGIPCVSTDRLVDAKRKIGRRKDFSDIALLQSHHKHRH